MLFRSKKDEVVSFVGDSPGSNTVVAVLLETLKADAGMQRPAKLMLIAPVVDLCFNNSRIKEVERYDPVLCLPIERRLVKSSADFQDLSDPRFYPVLADKCPQQKTRQGIWCDWWL